MSDGEWTEEEGGKFRLHLTPDYYDDPQRVHLVLLMATVDASEEEIAGWDSTQRKAAAEWAMSVHYSASDNEDVIVPPRPDFLRRTGDAA